MSLATQFDLTRSSIVENYRKRIQAGERTRLTRCERETLTLILLDRLISLNQNGQDSLERIRELCDSEKALLEEGFPQSSINSVYLPNYTRVIKEAIANGRLHLNDQNSYPKKWTKRDGSDSGTTQTHYALEFLTYDTATQNQLRSLTTANNNQRQDNLQGIRVYEYLAKVQELLLSCEPEILTIAIAALTGRRHTEVVSVGQFLPTQHPYLIHFQGQQKKADAVGYNILSLIAASELLPVIERYRTMPTMQALAGLDDTHPQVEAFNSRVNRRVQTIFGDTGLVPVLEGFKTVSIHRLRALYGAIAIHFFCRDNQHIHRFLQNYLGHVLDSEITAANSRATDHYFHYYLVDDNGTPITRRGVKLKADTTLPDHPQQEALEQGAQSSGEIPPPAKSTLQRASSGGSIIEKEAVSPSTQQLPFDSSQLQRLCAVLDAIYPNQPQEQQMSELLNALESRLQSLNNDDWMVKLIPPSDNTPVVEAAGNPNHLEPTQQQQPHREYSEIPKQTPQPIIDLSQTLALLTQQVITLSQQVTELTIERDSAKARLQDIDASKSELEHLIAENLHLKQAQSSLLAAYNELLQNNHTPSHLSKGGIGSVGRGGREGRTQVWEEHKCEELPTPEVPPTLPTLPTPTKPGSALHRAIQVFQAIKQWNHQHPESTFAITQCLLERDFHIYRNAVQQFLTAYHQQIQQHHNSIGVKNERGHNRKPGRNLQLLKNFVNHAIGK
ncbi:protelomerase family protein [Fischerella sp. PCC 9605]|uniref:protelomerase family protein n=1 Tax=Fischerella sp. PCC 9605 TaxID=1173024 RepID=UPI00047BE0A3|nr:protelomerase family protein [Fischerella sp. PCC 9605]